MIPRLSTPIRRSTVDIGRAFEAHCLRFLTEQLYMSLAQVGGAGDGGVDLRGWWTIPAPSSGSPTSDAAASPVSSASTGSDLRFEPSERIPSRRLRVLGQCKAERKALGPRTVRELEGVMAHQRDPHVPDAMAILLSQSGFSPKAMIHATSSSTPLLLVHLPGGVFGVEEDGRSEINVEGAMWNQALGGAKGILGDGWELRREILSQSGRDEVTGDTKVLARAGVWYNGTRFGGLDEEGQ